MKSKQFCSVCKEWLEMEVVPTGDGDDDGVIWYRCPRCQGFLPKLSSSESTDEPAGDAATTKEAPVDSSQDDDVLFDSPAEMMAARTSAEENPEADTPLGVDFGLDAVAPVVGEEETDGKPEAKAKPEVKVEPEADPITEYAAQLESALSELPPDAAGGLPYRPWEVYEVGQCIHHLAWEDCGIVVGKEQLPGNRQIIKVFFQEAGVVRLIEQADQ